MSRHWQTKSCRRTSDWRCECPNKGCCKKNLSAALITLLLHFGRLSQFRAENMNVRKWISESKNMRHYFVAWNVKKLELFKGFARGNLKIKFVPMKREQYRFLETIKCQALFWIHLLRCWLYYKTLFGTIIFHFTLPSYIFSLPVAFFKRIVMQIGADFMVTMNIVTICICFCSLVVLYPVIPKIVLCRLYWHH